MVNQSKVVNLEEFRKEKNKGTPIPTLKAFVPGEYYIHPESGTLAHVLFLTDKSVHFDGKAIYVMEDPHGCFYADILDEETCEGWHLLHPDVFLKAVEESNRTRNPDPPTPQSA